MTVATARSNMANAESAPMPEKDYRAILTRREKEILVGEADVGEKYYYRVVTRVRQKVNRLEDDIAVLDANHDTLGDELRNIVCDN